MKLPRTCVAPNGSFTTGIHRPYFHIRNFREHDYIKDLGKIPDNGTVQNRVNFPPGDVSEDQADVIYEIANPFDFNGTTYINSAWADPNAEDPARIRLRTPEKTSFMKAVRPLLEKNDAKGAASGIYDALPRTVLLAVAESSTDPDELVLLAEKACSFCYGPDGHTPSGLVFKKDPGGRTLPRIHDDELFDIIANNPFLPDAFKETMVLKPGIQGPSEITGEYLSEDGRTHVFEYLRRNSYIPWGHFAANMADRSIRYKAADLSLNDMKGMRHLYCQRTYARLARQLGIGEGARRRTMTEDELETLRQQILETLSKQEAGSLEWNASLWGWNFGFGYAHSGYRLHASHQQIHQQYAMIPKTIPGSDGTPVPSYTLGDMAAEFAGRYREAFGKDFFNTYLQAVKSNRRTDGRDDLESGLEIFEDENVLLFVPKAQTSQFELQLMPKRDCQSILHANPGMRKSLNLGILTALQTLESMGVEMVSSIEYAGRFDANDSSSRLVYDFLPKVPFSPGAFSEAQKRWILGHYPEDFAAACRDRLQGTDNDTS